MEYKDTTYICKGCNRANSQDKMYVYPVNPKVVYKNLQPHMHVIEWCIECTENQIKESFDSWTSDNDHVNKFIQNAQLKTYKRCHTKMEWISYEDFEDIEFLSEGGFGKLYSVRRKKGMIQGWNSEIKQWDRYNTRYNNMVALKILNDSQDISLSYLEEV